jgi:hypothetical protein
MTRSILLLALCLTGCAATSDPTSFWYIPPTTPQQDCQMSGGDWRTVTTYDTSGTPDVTNQCVTNERPHR